jgi:hypothetical protein
VAVEEHFMRAFWPLLAIGLAGCSTASPPDGALAPPPVPAPVAQGMPQSGPVAPQSGPSAKHIVYDGAGHFTLPDGSVVAANPGGGFTLPNGQLVRADGGGVTLPNGARCVSDGAGGYLCP